MEAIELGAVGTIFALHKARRVSVNYFEIAGKRCVDLLAPGQREIVLKEELAADGKVAQAVALVGATEVDADSAEALEACVRAGKARRATSATFCNASSSRSHAVLRLSIHVRPPPTLQLLESGAAGTQIRQCVCARVCDDRHRGPCCAFTAHFAHDRVLVGALAESLSLTAPVASARRTTRASPRA